MFAQRLSELFTDIGTLLEKYGGVYLQGIGKTLGLAIIATLIGCVIGLICGALNTIPCAKNDPLWKKILLRILRIIIRIYVEVFRGTPMILQAVFIYYGVPYFSGGNVQFTNIWSVAILVVSINTGAYLTESVRGGIMSIDVGQTEAAKAIGMTHWQTMVNVILPQALRNIMPQIGNNYIINVKDTSVMFIIGFTELFAVHKMAAGATFKYFPSATIEMVAYLCMTILASVILRKVEKWMAGKDNYELVPDDRLSAVAGSFSKDCGSGPFAERSEERSKGGRG